MLDSGGSSVTIVRHVLPLGDTILADGPPQYIAYNSSVPIEVRERDTDRIKNLLYVSAK